MIVHNVNQGSAEWFKLRQGIPTTSDFHNLITPAKGDLSEKWKAYQARLIWEKLVNTTTVSLQGIQVIEDGKALESYARKMFEYAHDVEIEQVGFVTTDDGLYGSSPDGFLPRRAATFEVKCPTGHVHMKRLLFGHENDYKPQIQGQVLVCEVDKGVFYSYADRAPAYEIETGRDEPYLKKMRAALREFSDNWQINMEKALSLGVYQAFEDIVLPLEREHGPGMRKDLPEPGDAGIDWSMSG